jgi:hypothetical protein
MGKETNIYVYKAKIHDDDRRMSIDNYNLKTTKSCLRSLTSKLFPENYFIGHNP